MATTTINLGLSLDDLSNVDSTGKATGDVLEWNGVSGKWEAATPSGGGGTPAGSTGEVQFNDAGAFGADSAFVWDNTNKRLGVGASPASTVRLDVRAQGALSTDIAFRVRNSANTFDIFSTNGVGISTFRYDTIGSGGTYFPLRIVSATTNYQSWLGLDIEHTTRTGYFSLESQGLQTNYNHVKFKSGGSKSGAKVSAYITQTNTDLAGHWHFRTQIHLGEAIRTYDGSFGQHTIVMENGNNPSSSPIDGFVQYSADIVAGNAAPHFRTEDGSVIKLYQQSSAGISTVADIVTVLQNLGLLS